MKPLVSRAAGALKGEAQTQGAWGEMLLESILEKSGLRADHPGAIAAAQARSWL